MKGLLRRKRKKEVTMKRVFWSVALLAFLSIGFGMSAYASTSLELVDPANNSTLFVNDNAATVCTGADCNASIPPADQNAATGAITLAGFTFGGYSLTVTTGGSNTPNCSGSNGPGCLNTTNITATNISSGTATLEAFFASTGFTTPHPLIVGFSTPGETGTTATQQAFATPGAVNTLGPGVVNPIPGNNPCGALLTITGPTGNTSLGSGCPNPAIPYSLMLATTMTTGAGGAFNLNGTISSEVPEPASLALFGTVLAFCASRLRRRSKVS
jgi:hypothetical protein